MIERNLGNADRLIRLLAGSAFMVWILNQPHLNGIDWFVVTVSLLLITNGVFSRCYLWYVLDINTHQAATQPQSTHGKFVSNSQPGC